MFSPLYFLAQTLHTFYKSSPSMCRFPNFFLLKSKSIVSFFKQKVSFSSKLLLLFSVMRDHSSVVLNVTENATLNATEKSNTSKCKFSDLKLLASKLTKFLMSFYEAKASFFFYFCITLQCHET